MLPRKIVCAACGIEASRIHIQGKPRLEVEAIMFHRSCIERADSSDPFSCPHMLNAAMDASLVGIDGSLIELPEDLGDLKI
jgi:hypothetical protein